MLAVRLSELLGAGDSLKHLLQFRVARVRVHAELKGELVLRLLQQGARGFPGHPSLLEAFPRLLDELADTHGDAERES